MDVTYRGEKMLQLLLFEAHTHTHTRVEIFLHLSLFVLSYGCPHSLINSFSVLCAKTLKSHSSPLGSLPHLVAIIPVEVGRQFLLTVHITGLDHIREAQRPEGQSLHCPLNHLDVTASTCCIRLYEDGEHHPHLS